MKPVAVCQVDILPEWNDRLLHHGKNPLVGGEEEEEQAPFHQYLYYPDLNRRFVFYTGSVGAQFMCKMQLQCDKALDLCRQRMTEYATKNNMTFADVEKRGSDIYGAKPSKAEEGVTWSQKDYDFPGLQYFYLSLKSVQRYTEGFTATQRLYNQGFFEPYIRADTAYSLAVAMQEERPLDEGVQLSTSSRPNMASSEKDCSGSLPRLSSEARIPKPKKFVCVSLGGGPGFELIAVQHLFQILCPNTEFVAISVDLAETWKDYVEAMGMQFSTCDLSVRNLKQALQDSYRRAGIIKEDENLHVDMFMLSYIYSMYLAGNGPRSELLGLLGPVNEWDSSQDIPHNCVKELPRSFAEESISFRNRSNKLQLPCVIHDRAAASYTDVAIPSNYGEILGAKCLFILERASVYSYQTINQDPRFMVQRLVSRQEGDDRQAADRRSCFQVKAVHTRDQVPVTKDTVELSFVKSDFVRVKVSNQVGDSNVPVAVEQQRDRDDGLEYVCAVDFDVQFLPMHVVFPNVPYISRRKQHKNSSWQGGDRNRRVDESVHMGGSNSRWSSSNNHNHHNRGDTNSTRGRDFRNRNSNEYRSGHHHQPHSNNDNKDNSRSSKIRPFNAFQE